jgi:hypothetical protein
MHNIAEQKLRTAALVVTAFLLLQLIWGGLRLLLVSAPDPVMPVADSLKARVVDYPMGSREAGAELVDRPVFWQGRKSFEPKEVVEAKPVVSTGAPAGNDPINNVKLLGVFGGGEKQGIIVVYKKNKQRLIQGEDLDGWVLQYMSAASVIFEKGDSSFTVDLKHAVVGNKTK